jgi:hypothetical protein
MRKALGGFFRARPTWLRSEWIAMDDDVAKRCALERLGISRRAMAATLPARTCWIPRRWIAQADRTARAGLIAHRKDHSERNNNLAFCEHRNINSQRLDCQKIVERINRGEIDSFSLLLVGAVFYGGMLGGD